MGIAVALADVKIGSVGSVPGCAEAKAWWGS